MERTLIIVKPHAVKRGLVGLFLTRFEAMGLSILAATASKGTKELWERFYPSDTTWLKNVGLKTVDDCVSRKIDVGTKLGTSDPVAIGRMVKGWLVEHMSSDISVAIVLAGNDAQTKVRAACGSTLPNKAAPGTIRFEFSTDSPSLANDEMRPVFNLIHASDPTEERDGQLAADYEIGLLFPELGK